MTAVATGEKAQHNITLSDGVATIGINLSNISGIRQLPRGVGVERKSLVSEGWTGGRGNKLFSKDKTKFYDSGWLWTLNDGYVFNAPQWKYAKGIRAGQDQNLAGSVTFTSAYSTTRYMAKSFAASASYTAAKVSLILRRVGTPGTLTVELRSDSGGDPGSVLATATVTTSTITDWLSLFYPFTFSQALTSGTTYWIVVYGASTDNVTNHWEIGQDAATTGKKSTAGSSWSAANGLFYRVIDSTTAPSAWHLFEYKRAIYAVTKPSSGASALYLNGDRGVATGSSGSTTLSDSTKAWTTDEWAGCVALITAGTGQGQYRKITANTANVLTVDTAWDTVPSSTSSEYVILGSEKWQSVSLTLAAPVTDVAIANGFVYFAMGDSQAIRRYRGYVTGGAWTNQNADDGTNKATYLLVANNSSGVLTVYKANNDTVAYATAAAVSTWTDLTFGTAVQVGDTDSKITALASYDSTLWVGKEDGLWKLNSSGVLVPILNAMKVARDEYNNVNMGAWNTNLYFPFLNGWERLYSTTIDDIGVNRDAGMPNGRNGRVADWMPVLQRAYIAWNGGTANKSAIMVTEYPGGSWHEIYRAPEAGLQIGAVIFQSIPNILNRLWFTEGADIGWMYLPDDVLNPLNDTNMLYTWEGYMIGAWIDLDSPDLDHLFDKLRVFSENLIEVNGIKIEVDYQLDGASDTSAWNRMSEDYVFPPFQVERLNVTGWRFRPRYRFLTGVAGSPAIATALELRANVINESLYDYIIDFSLADKMMLLNGGESNANALDIINILTQWQARAPALTLRTGIDGFDNVTGNIDPISLVPVSWNPKEEKLAGSITFKVVDRTISCFVIVAGDTITVTETWDIASCLTIDGTLTASGTVTVT
jgi:hypothetical protein